MSLAEFLRQRTTHKGFKPESQKDIIGLDLDIMRQDHENGVKIAEYCHIPEMRKNFAWMRGHQNCWTGYPNDGKAVALDTILHTPDGGKKMGEIRVGDVVFDEKGNTCNVVFTSEVQYEKRCYRLTFNDGNTIDCCEDHLWITYSANALRSYRRRARKQTKELKRKGSDQSHNWINPSVVTTKDIINDFTSFGRYNHYIPVAEPINYPQKNLLIDPYTLGAWLGDGTSESGSITCDDEFIISEISKKYKTKKNSAKYMYSIWGLKVQLRTAGVLGNKHIPECYLTASISQRMDLLQGLMDTDGSCMKSGMCEFTSTKEDLAKGVYRLICSLGIKAGISKSDAKIYGRKTSDRWRITFKTSKKVFRLKRKLDRIPKKHSIRQDFRSIVKWEDIQSIPVKCIQVDSPNKMYLFGDGFIPTHNTTFVLFMMTTMSLETSWKWVIWSPEMKSANIVDGKVKVNYNTIAYEIMAILSGKTPYKHLAEKYQIPFMTFEEIEMHKEWIDMHFIFLDPEKKDIKSMYNTLNVIWKDQGFDGILIDPFKNIEKETIKREDQHLHDVFAEFKDFAIRTDVSMNWIAHPRSGVSRISHDGQLNPCNQYMLAGGAAWDNSMDGIYSVLRPDSLDDISSPRVRFYNLKQRMSELVAQRGEVDDIEFDIRTRRYNFKSIEPLKF